MTAIKTWPVVESWTVDVDNQQTIGAVIVDQKQCPDLFAQTLKDPNDAQAYSRLLPVGWRRDVREEPSTGNQVDHLVSPQGKIFEMQQCGGIASSETILAKGGGGTLILLAAAAAVFYLVWRK